MNRILEQVVDDVVIFNVQLGKEQLDLIIDLFILVQEKHQYIDNFSFEL